uniref:G-protein coupled receptors family 1 profile domain-containing protein n=1 Tax=Lepisosteus oculatus TaxID=7918 RepID=W5MU08_LEPOC
LAMADYMDLIYMSFEIWIAFTCCLGNALVIWAVKLNHSLREPTFCFIVSLAVADFLVGAVAIPSAIFVNSEVETSFHGCLFICCIVMILTESSILSLLAIAVDRYLHIKMPFRYRRIAAQKQSWLGVAVCWLISGILGLVPIFGWHNKGSMNSTGNSAINARAI